MTRAGTKGRATRVSPWAHSSPGRRAALAQIPVGHYGQPEDVADAVAYLRDARFVTGETLNVNGGELMR